MNARLKMLFCPDFGALRSELAHQWVVAFSNHLLGSNFDVTVLLNCEAPELENELVSRGVRVILPSNESTVEAESGCVPARYHARSVLREALYGRQIQYDVVLTQGVALSRYVAGGKSIQPAHWALIADNPMNPGNPKDLNLESVRIIAAGARLLLFASPETRAFVESRVPSATSKTRLLDAIPLERVAAEATATPTFVFDYNRYRAKWAPHTFDALLEEAKLIRRPPQIIVVDDQSNGSEWNHALKDYPGVKFVCEGQLAIPQTGVVYVAPAASTEDDERLLASLLRENDSVKKLSASSVTLESLSATASKPQKRFPEAFRTAFESDLPDYDRTPLARDHAVRVLLAGADFKFAGDLADSLIQRDDIALSVDLFEANAKPQPQKSQPLLQSAEVIIAEFASKNAIWYSQNVRPDQHLIVHLHGYELLQDWITELNIDNCDAIVFASEFYRQKAIEMRGWPAEKLVVIPNSVNFGDLARRKSPDARFNIGLVGIVPILKRPDRALDLLESLLAEDERYTLHIRGHSPWNYGWEWKKSAHQDSYRTFYNRIGSNPVLRQNVVFEPFSPDIANWLQDIGWLLSPSTRETFHLSAIEGAASGAVPIAWRREGSDEIIGEQFNFDSTAAAARYIANVDSAEEFDRLSDSAQNYARKYSTSEVRAKWLDLIFSLATADNAVQLRTSEADRVFQTVSGAWNDDDPETAISVLDEHVPLTSSHRGPLKDAEMFFRGIASADEKRFTQFLPLQLQAVGGSRQIAIVRPDGATFDAAELSPDIRTFIGVIPPAFVQHDGYQPVSESCVSLPAPNNARIQVDGFTRVDRWFEMVKAHLMPIALSHTELAVQGPWWVALPVIQAADQTGIPCTWFIDDEQTLKWISAASHGELRTHFAAQIAWNCFQATDARGVMGSCKIPSDFDIGSLDSCIGDNEFGIPQWDPEEAGAAHYSSGPLNRTNAPAMLARTLENTRIGMVADRAFSREWSRYTSVVDLAPETFEEQLDASFDVAVIHPNANTSGSWKKKLEQANETAQCEATKLYDRARLLGATTCFVWDSQDPLPMRFWAVARKADAVFVTYPSTLDRFLQINPSAVRAISWWDTNLPLQNRLQLALRGVYQPVTIDRLNLEIREHSVADTPNTLSSEELANEELPELERIAVFTDVPAHLWTTQTLPARLFDIVPLAELPNRDSIDADHFVVFNSEEAPDDNYLLSLWLEADDDVIVVPSSIEDSQLPSGIHEVAYNCLYPMHGDPSLLRTRQAVAM